MATPPNPTTRSDIGPISDSSGLGETGHTPAADAASARTPRPDSGDPVLEPATPESSGDPSVPESNGATSRKLQPDPVAQQTASPPPVEPGKEPAADPDRQRADGGEDEPRGVGKPWPALDYSQKHDAVEAELLERMRAKYGTSLVSDMDDAQLLLSYVTRNGLQEDRKVGDDVIQTLISSREHMRSFTFNSEKEEVKFRKSCGIIAKAAQPVTAVSLRDSLTTEPYRRWLFMEPKPLPVAEIACRRYRALAILALLALLVVQVYWTALSSILTRTDALISEINNAPSQEYYVEQEAKRLAALKAARQLQSSPAPATSPANSASTTQATLTEVKVDKTQLTLNQLVSKIAELDANYYMLETLAKWWPLSQTYVRDTSPPRKEPNEDDPSALFAPSAFQTRNASINAVARQAASQIIDVTQKWVLPLLYGALGAMVFVVRTLSMQARDRLFRREALVSLVLRVFLGMISGLAIGWFWNQSATGPTTAGALTPTTLSPFALAFVAGYGVELFFALLDKIVSTFTNKA
jgi:type II secretory pathway component PulM